MNSKYAIVGAGLMGRLLAVALAQRGAQVDLFEQGGPHALESPARIAAAMLLLVVVLCVRLLLEAVILL